MKNHATPFVAMLLAAGAVLAAPPPESEALVALFREQLVAELETGTYETASALAEALAEGVVPHPEVARDLADTAREALRARARTDRRARRLRTRIAALQATPPTALRGFYDPFEFPRDEGAHPQLSEWWYWNGHLETPDGRRFGFQLCYFRIRVGIYFLHYAVSDEAAGTFVYDRRYHLPSKVAFSKERLALDYGGHTATGTEGEGQELRFAVGKYQVELMLRPKRDPMHVNGDGVIDMPEGGMSRYYSRTDMQTTGMLTIDGQPVPVHGQSWFDHQWGNFYCLFKPWDWFAFQMPDGTEYNLFSFRRGEGQPARSHVNVLAPDGTLTVSDALVIRRKQWWQSPKSGKHYVTAWELDLPGRGETFTVEATMQDQEMPRVDWKDIPPDYWEGAMRVTRKAADGRVDAGRGFSEHMPYKKPWAR